MSGSSRSPACVIFTGLTAYDTQWIKESYSANDDGTVSGRKADHRRAGALSRLHQHVPVAAAAVRQPPLRRCDTQMRKAPVATSGPFCLQSDAYAAHALQLRIMPQPLISLNIFHECATKRPRLDHAMALIRRPKFRPVGWSDCMDCSATFQAPQPPVRGGLIGQSTSSLSPQNPSLRMIAAIWPKAPPTPPVRMQMPVPIDDHRRLRYRPAAPKSRAPARRTARRRSPRPARPPHSPGRASIP